MEVVVRENEAYLVVTPAAHMMNSSMVSDVVKSNRKFGVKLSSGEFGIIPAEERPSAYLVRSDLTTRVLSHRVSSALKQVSYEMHTQPGGFVGSRHSERVIHLNGKAWADVEAELTTFLQEVPK
jgi:hypothetical protein